MYILNDYLFSIDIEDINIIYGKQIQPSQNIVNPSLQEYLTNIKCEINKYYDKWDSYKKITNKYEYINTPFFLENKKVSTCVCSYKPISRSYFKMIEILKHFDFKFPKNLKSFHLAEGPGGFIEAINNYRNNNNDIYIGMTLMEDHKDVPKWNKIQSFMRKNKNIKIVYGPKNDGNLYLKHNLDYINSYHKNMYDFVTADGGFDYSTDFNKQEENSINLIFCEILYALHLQKENGSFILKIFDMFHETTLEMLYILSYFYKQVYVYKPYTSREANSEKYIICKCFKMNANYLQIMNKLTNNFQDLSKQKLNKIIKFPLNSFFVSKIQEINAIYGQQQVENILNTINYIQDSNKIQKERLEKIKQTNIERCIKWCKEHEQPVHSVILDTLSTK